jgi:hypothetical protein
VLGRFKASGIRPRCAERLKAYGVDLSTMLFANAPQAHPTPGRSRW